MRTGTGFLTVMVTVIALVFGRAAPAAPVLSFDSVTVTADGLNPTPVQILVNVTNPDASVNVRSLDSQLSWTVSGGATLTDLVSLGTGSASTGGYLFATVFDSFAFDSGTSLPLNWGVATTGAATMNGSGATTPVATLNFEIPAGVTSGVFNVSFLTGNPNFNVFTDASFEPIPYANGNDGQPTGTGLITVVPEPTTTSILALCAVLVTGVGFAQRSARLKTRPAEIAG